MLRRNPDDSFDLLVVEGQLRAGLRHHWAPQAKAALRARIFDSLEEQVEPAPRIGLLAGERWIAVPAGIGLAAAILLTLRALDDVPPAPQGSGTATVYSARTLPQELSGAPLHIQQPAWLRTSAGAAIGLEPGTVISPVNPASEEAVRFEGGRLTVATASAVFSVLGIEWIAEVEQDSVAVFVHNPEAHFVSVLNGSVRLTSGGATRHIGPDDPPFSLSSEGGTVHPAVFEDPQLTLAESAPAAPDSPSESTEASLIVPDVQPPFPVPPPDDSDPEPLPGTGTTISDLERA